MKDINHLKYEKWREPNFILFHIEALYLGTQKVRLPLNICIRTPIYYLNILKYENLSNCICQKDTACNSRTVESVVANISWGAKDSIFCTNSFSTLASIPGNMLINIFFRKNLILLKIHQRIFFFCTWLDYSALSNAKCSSLSFFPTRFESGAVQYFCINIGSTGNTPTM